MDTPREPDQLDPNGLQPIPQFAEPTPIRPSTVLPATGSNIPSPNPFAPSSPKPGGNMPTRTGTSSPELSPPVDPLAAAAIVAGLIGLAAGAAAWVLLHRARPMTLRRPTYRQVRDIATPLTELLLRHSDVAWLTPDLGDILTAGAAAGHYVTDGPIVRPAASDPNLTQEDQ